MLEEQKIILKRRPNASCSLEIMCECIIKAWNEIKPEIIQRSFKKCTNSSNLNKMEDETEFDNVPGDITEDEYNQLFMLYDKENV